MSTARSDIGTALAAIVTDLDISAVAPAGWSLVANYPLKQVTGWPTVAIVPAEGQEQDLDNYDDDVSYQWWIVLFYSYEQAATAEAKTRHIADVLATRLRQEKRATPPLGLPSTYAVGEITQAWDFDEAHGLRYYRLSLTFKVDEQID